MTTLPNLETARRWRNLTLVAGDGTAIGRIESIYVDYATGRPEWALVRVDAGNGARRAFVPLTGANEQAGRVTVQHERTRINGAPVLASQTELTRAQETQLYDHYGIPYSTAASASVLPAAEADPSDLDHPLADDEMNAVGSAVDTTPGGGGRKAPGAAGASSDAVQAAFATEPLVATEHAHVEEVPPARGRGRLVARGLALGGLAAAAGAVAVARRRQPPGLTERLGLGRPRRRGLLGRRSRRPALAGFLATAGQALGAGMRDTARQATGGAAAVRRRLPGGRPPSWSGRARAAAGAAAGLLPGRSRSKGRMEVTTQMRKSKRKLARAQRRLERATGQLAEAGTRAAQAASRSAEQRARRAAQRAELAGRRAATQAEAVGRRANRTAADAAGTVTGATGAVARAAAGTVSAAARSAGDAAGTLAGKPAQAASAAGERLRDSIPRRQRRSKRMRKLIGRLGLAIGAAVGYVLGSKAGRERYDQIVGAAKQLGERPEVKRIVEQAPGAIEGKVGQVAEKAADKVGQARERVAPGGSTTGGTGAGKQA